MCQKNDYTRRTVTVLLAVITALFVFSAMQVAAQVATGGTFRLEQTVIAGGGGTSADAGGNVFRLEGTIGEAVAGANSTGAPFSVKGGFLSAAQPLAPTAAAVSISGRVVTSGGGGLVNARVTLTAADGTSQTVLTRKTGAFVFNDVNAGETYFISVASRRYTFAVQVFSVMENLTGIEFVGQSSGVVF